MHTRIRESNEVYQDSRICMGHSSFLAYSSGFPYGCFHDPASAALLLELPADSQRFPTFIEIATVDVGLLFPRGFCEVMRG